MIDAEKTRAWDSGDIRQHYDARDCILYALGLGVGSDPLDPLQLRFTYEQGLQVVPSMAAVLASPGFWMRERSELGIDFVRLVHGEQSITLHAPLPAAATVLGRSRVTRLVDKGAGKGALMHVEKQLRREDSGQLLATTEQVLFLRGDGGFSNGGGDTPAPPPPMPPETAPDQVIDMPTRRDAALLYRLSGDLNPLHVDPAVAARAGFERPILHGLASYGMACHGLIAACCGGDPTQLKSIRARLSSPVFPGETIRLEIWQLPEGQLRFRGHLLERDVVVLSHGQAQV